MKTLSAFAIVVTALATPAFAASVAMTQASSMVPARSCTETTALDVNWTSERVLEWVNATVSDLAHDAVRTTGRLPHRINHAWHANFGNDAQFVRLHFSRFALGGASLDLRSVGSTLGQTLRGAGPMAASRFPGWSNWIPGPALSWTLVANEIYADASYGFAIDRVEVIRNRCEERRTVSIGAPNREWRGAIAENQSHTFVVPINTRGRYDVYLEGANGKALDLTLALGTGSPPPEWRREGAGASKVIAGATLEPGLHSVRVRNPRGTGPGTYVFMVNRVVATFDLRVEFDDALTESDDLWAARRCQVEHLLREANERLYGATDGFFRLGTVTVFRTAHWWRDVDVVFEDEIARGRAFFWDLGHIQLGRNHLDHYSARGCERPACVDRPGEPYCESNGGATLVHELGHFKFEIWDEYRRVDGTSHSLCPTSLMAQSARFEFCTAANHNWNTGEWGWLFSQHGQSAWEEIREGHPEIPAEKLMATPNPHVFQGSAIRDLVEIQFRD